MSQLSEESWGFELSEALEGLRAVRGVGRTERRGRDVALRRSLTAHGHAGDGVLRLTRLFAVAVVLLPRLTPVVVVVLAGHALLGATGSHNILLLESSEIIISRSGTSQAQWLWAKRRPLRMQRLIYINNRTHCQATLRKSVKTVFLFARAENTPKLAPSHCFTIENVAYHLRLYFYLLE